MHNIHKDAIILPFVMVRDEMSCSFTLTILAQKDMLETKLESEIHSKERKRDTMRKQITAIIVGAGHRAILYSLYALEHPDELKIRIRSGGKRLRRYMASGRRCASRTLRSWQKGLSWQMR